MQAPPQSRRISDEPRETDRKADLNLALRRKWLRRLFWVWIGGSMAVASYLLLAGPLTPYTGLDDRHVALALPLLMVLMLASGLTWLVMLVRSRPRRR
jgi:hypothetical protein